MDGGLSGQEVTQLQAGVQVPELRDHPQAGGRIERAVHRGQGGRLHRDRGGWSHSRSAPGQRRSAPRYRQGFGPGDAQQSGPWSASRHDQQGSGFQRVEQQRLVPALRLLAASFRGGGQPQYNHAHFEIMNKILRIIIGVLLIIGGLAVVFLSVSLFPQPVEWGKIFFSFLPIFAIGVGTIFLGWGVISGMTWHDILDYVLLLWR